MQASRGWNILLGLGLERSRHVLPPKPRILHGVVRSLDLGLLDVSNHGRPLDPTKPLGEEII